MSDAQQHDLPDAGWFDDARDPTLLRYWDGSAWTEHTRDRAQTPPSESTETPDSPPRAPKQPGVPVPRPVSAPPASDEEPENSAPRQTPRAARSMPVLGELPPVPPLLQVGAGTLATVLIIWQSLHSFQDLFLGMMLAGPPAALAARYLVTIGYSDAPPWIRVPASSMLFAFLPIIVVLAMGLLIIDMIVVTGARVAGKQLDGFPGFTVLTKTLDRSQLEHGSSQAAADGLGDIIPLGVITWAIAATTIAFLHQFVEVYTTSAGA